MKMTPQICYASLAIYSKRDMEDEISTALQTSPVRVGERRGNYSWIYSTQDAPNCGTVEQHVQLLKAHFDGHTHELVRFSKEGCEIRAWIYFGSTEINQSFVLATEFVGWLSLFGADIYVDVWANENS